MRIPRALISVLAALGVLTGAHLAAAQPLPPGTHVVPPGSVCTVLPGGMGGLSCVVPVPPDTTPPLMSSITVPGSTITTSSATVTLTTNEAARATVEYGPTTAYGSSAGPSPLGTAHAIPLTPLTPATLYHYRVRATDAAGNASAPSPDGTFQVQAPLTYDLTIALSGGGSATTTVTPAGPQPAGTARTLTVTPTGGATLGAWSAGCAESMAQPAANTVCTRTVTPPVTPPPTGGTGTWTRLVQGQPFNSLTNPSPTNWYYDCFAVERVAPGRVWGHWSNRTYLFDPTQPESSRWKIVPNAIDWRENFGCTHDGVKFRLGPGAPVASGSNPPIWDGSVVYDAGPSTYAKDTVTIGTGHTMYYFDAPRNRILAFGGWSSNLPLAARSLATDQVTQLTATTPTYTQDGPRETLRRSGVTGDGTVWFISDNNSLWLAAPPNYSWTQVATTGTRPTSTNGVYAYHKGANTIVGWIGCDSFGETCQGKPAINQTYLLDLGTKTWRLGPGTQVLLAAMRAAPPPQGYHAPAPKRPHTQKIAPKGAPPKTTPRAAVRSAPGPLPPITVMVVQQLIEDEANNRVLWVGLDWETGGTSIWAWTPSAGTPPVSQYPVTLAAGGTGSGTMTGAGSYAAGAPVALTATPAADSTFGGWSPAPCAASFAMPASAVACTATFMKTVTPPTGTLPPKTFVAKPLPSCPTNLSQYPFCVGTGSKDINWGTALINGEWWPIAGYGDSTNSGRGGLHRYDWITNTWPELVGECVPLTVSQVQPNHPSDRGPMIGDKRGAIWNWNNIPFPDAEGQSCGTGYATMRKGLLMRDAAGAWTVKGGMGNSIGGGAYDSTADAMLHFEMSNACAGNPGRLVATDLTTLAQQSWDLCVRPSPSWSGATGGWVAPLQPNRVFFAWDDVNRVVYVVAAVFRYDASGNVAETRMQLSVFDRKTSTWSIKAPAPARVAEMDIASFHIRVFYDRGRVLWPVVKDGPCGTIHQMLVYTVATDTWEEFPVPAGIRSNSTGYDPRAQALVLAGSQFCSVNPGQSQLWLWSYDGR